MAFVPPFFTKFGSSADDLIKKKLEADEKHTLVINSQSKNIKATHTINTVKGSTANLQAKLALKYEDKKWGDSTVEFNTAGKLTQDVRFTKLAPGTIVTARAETNTKLSAASGSTNAQYKQESFAGSFEYKHDKKALFTGLSFGYEGFSLGTQVTANIGKLANGDAFGQAVDVDGGLQYEDRNLTGTFIINHNNTINLSVFHNINKGTQVAGKLIATSDKGNSAVIAAQHIIAPNTVVKGKVHVVDDKSYIIAAHVEHKIASPDLTVGVSTSIDSKKQTPAFSISATFNAQ